MALKPLRRGPSKLKKVRKSGRQAIPEEVRIQRELQEAEAKLLKDWTTQNNEFSAEDYTDTWLQQRGNYKRSFADLVTKYLSLVEGAQEANNVLKYGLKMDEASVDIALLGQIVEKAMVVDVATLIARQLQASTEVQDEFLKRIIARELPMRDNVPARQPVLQNPVAVPISRPASSR